ncbi:E4 ORF2 [Bat mastadenovirus WIV12]|uniref:E4 ORF2 n=1 Tax=Bat mastadenovirus WIV12 TaxID=1788434 RepID=A0A1B0UI10_9ADEN|nr:E4 ORF2 [Bat mastadenovirus WIV12]AMB43169.1 E4 ORF2 [Bat mastadenovirus WIV12]
MPPRVTPSYLLGVTVTEDFKQALNFLQPSFTIALLKACCDELKTFWELNHEPEHSIYVTAFPIHDYRTFLVSVAGPDYHGTCLHDVHAFAAEFETSLRSHFLDIAYRVNVRLDFSDLTVTPLDNWFYHVL